jgi:hypothetical protein
MGGGILSACEVKRREAARAENDRIEQESANGLAERIIGLINSIVIRPGPKPEERECTQVASELEALRPQIVELILERD